MGIFCTVSQVIPEVRASASGTDPRSLYLPLAVDYSILAYRPQPLKLPTNGSADNEIVFIGIDRWFTVKVVIEVHSPPEIFRDLDV